MRVVMVVGMVVCVVAPTLGWGGAVTQAAAVCALAAWGLSK